MHAREPAPMIVSEATPAMFEGRKPYHGGADRNVVIAGMCLLMAGPASAAGGIGIGSGRLVPGVAAVVGLIGMVLGGLALARSARRIARQWATRGHCGRGRGVDQRRRRRAACGERRGRDRHRQRTGRGHRGHGGGLISLALGGLALARSRRTADRLTG